MGEDLIPVVPGEHLPEQMTVAGNPKQGIVGHNRIDFAFADVFTPGPNLDLLAQRAVPVRLQMKIHDPSFS